MDRTVVAEQTHIVPDTGHDGVELHSAVRHDGVSSACGVARGGPEPLLPPVWMEVEQYARKKPAECGPGREESGRGDDSGGG